MAKQRLTPEQTERFVALQAALRQHFFAPSLNKLGEHIRQSKKTLSRYADFGYTAMPTTLDNICNSIIRFYELNEEFFRTLPHQFALSEKLYQVWKAHSPGSLASVCEWIVQLSSGVIPETFPTADREELTTLLQARSSAFSWLSLVLAHFFIKSAGHFEGKSNEIPRLLKAFEALDTKLLKHYPRQYGRNIYPFLADQLPMQDKEQLSRCYFVQLAELIIGEYSNPDAERNPRMGSHLQLGSVSCWHKVGELPADGSSLWLIREPTRTPDGMLTPKSYTITEFVLKGSTLCPSCHARISFNAEKQQLIYTHFNAEAEVLCTTYHYALNDTDTQFHFSTDQQASAAFLPEALDRVSATHDDAGELWQRLIDLHGETQLAREAFLYEMSLIDLVPVSPDEMEVVDAARTRKDLFVNLRHRGEQRDIQFHNVDAGILKNVLPNDTVEIFYDQCTELFAFYWPAHDELAYFDPKKTYNELISEIQSDD